MIRDESSDHRILKITGITVEIYGNYRRRKALKTKGNITLGRKKASFSWRYLKNHFPRRISIHACLPAKGTQVVTNWIGRYPI
jgi:hypothetical protein